MQRFSLAALYTKTIVEFQVENKKTKRREWEKKDVGKVRKAACLLSFVKGRQKQKYCSQQEALAKYIRRRSDP